MLRFGVWSLEQLQARRIKDFLGREKNVSVELYEEAQRGLNGSSDQEQEIVLDHFKFGHVFKRTHANRFAAFDDALLSAVVKQVDPTPDAPIRVHDIAASDGRTSLDLYEKSRGIFKDRVRFLATDLLPWVYSIRRPEGSLRAITDDRGEVIQIIHPPFVFDLARNESWFYWLNHIVQSRHVKLATALASLFLSDPSMVEVKKIYLIHQRCRKLMQEGRGFTFERYNVLEPIDREFDLVRAMNILNQAYFGEDEIRRILRSIFESLRAGGIFATGSNEGRGSEVEGGIYLRTEKGFRLLLSAGSGSRVHGTISSFVAAI